MSFDFQKQPPEMFYEKVLLKPSKFHRKTTVLEPRFKFHTFRFLRLPLKFAKSLRTPILEKSSKDDLSDFKENTHRRAPFQ